MNLILLLFLFCASCKNTSEVNKKGIQAKGEYLYRLHDEYLFVAEPPQKVPQEPYPWEEGQVGNLPKITKEYFRCKGSSLNPPRTYQENGEIRRLIDCGGSARHSLPLRNGKEFIYPILIELLNYIQAKTGKRVVVTCGHRCPEHNSYSDPSLSARHSKHQIGAEVSFYVQSLEDRPETIIKHLQTYYVEKGEGEFKRYEKGDTDISTQPWYNKEIFIKLYKKKEGRDYDNRHPYPYISIQVRYDKDLGEKVIYDWHKATQNYMRK